MLKVLSVKAEYIVLEVLLHLFWYVIMELLTCHFYFNDKESEESV